RRSPSKFDPDVVGSLYPKKRPVDPDGPDGPTLPNWNSVLADNALPELPVIETDADRETTDVQSIDGLWYYVPPEGFLDNDGLNPNPGEVEFAKVCFRLRLNGRGLGEMDFILRRPPIVLVHGLNGNPATWDLGLWNETILKTKVYLADYSTTNTMGYDVSWPHIPNNISTGLNNYRNGIDSIRYAATRID